MQFILTIYADPIKADADFSRILSPAESFSLALALSLDGIAAGIGGGLIHFNIWFVLLFTFVLTILCVAVGAKLGEKLAKKIPLDLSSISGIILIAIAFLKFI